MQNSVKKLSRLALFISFCVSVNAAETHFTSPDLDTPGIPPLGTVTINTSCLAQNLGGEQATNWTDLIGKTVFKTGSSTESPSEDEAEKFYSELGLPSTISMNTKCPPASGGVKELPEGCENFDVKSIEKVNMQAMRGYACNIKKGDALLGEMGCLRSSIQSLNQNVATMKNNLSPILQKAEKDMETINSMLLDRETQQKEIVSRLQGNPETGNKGLLQIKQELEGLAKTLPTIATKTRQNAENIQLQNERFETLIQQNKMSIAMDCFDKRPREGYRCSVNGPLVSAKEYILCRYEQSQYQSTNGRTVVRGNEKIAKSRRESLKALFDNISADAPSMVKFPPAGDTAAWSNTMQSYPINTPKQLMDRYGSYLGNMKAGNASIGAFMQQEINKCYKEASQEVDRQRTDANSQISLNQKVLRDQEEQFQADTKGVILDYSSKYSEAVKGNTGLQINMNTGPCLQGKPADQASCVNALSNALNTVLTGQITTTDAKQLTPAAMALTGGKTPIFGFDQDMPATNANLKFRIKCAGVNGCVTALQAAERGIKNDSIKIQTNKTNYQQSVNRGITQQAQQLGKAFSAASGELSKRMAALSRAFAQAGVGGALSLKKREINGKEIQPNEKTGMYGVDDLENLIFANTSPPLLMLDDEGFAAAESKLSDERKKQEEELSQLKDVMEQMRAKEDSCKGASKSKKCETKLAECKTMNVSDPLNSILRTLGEAEIINLQGAYTQCMSEYNVDMGCDGRASEASYKPATLPTGSSRNGTGSSSAGEIPGG
jgi:hypothetical protein